MSKIIIGIALGWSCGVVVGTKQTPIWQKVVCGILFVGAVIANAAG